MTDTHLNAFKRLEAAHVEIEKLRSAIATLRMSARLDKERIEATNRVLEDYERVRRHDAAELVGLKELRALMNAELAARARRVIVESPYHGDLVYSVADNVSYARRCMFDSLRRGEFPFLSHLLYTQVLDDDKPEERALGINAGFGWGSASCLTAVYTDHGVSAGMSAGIEQAEKVGRQVEYRSLGG